jgi:hypothetical protein
MLKRRKAFTWNYDVNEGATSLQHPSCDLLKGKLSTSLRPQRNHPNSGTYSLQMGIPIMSIPIQDKNIGNQYTEQQHKEFALNES